MIQFLAALLALALLAVILQDAFEVMLLPRRVHRRFRLMGVYFRTCWAAWGALAGRIKDPPRREHVLSLFGPLSMLLFAVWAGTLIGAFGLLEWAVQGGGASPVLEQAYMSDVTFFTLGYGDVVPHTGAARLVAVLEAGTGIGFIAVVIGYEPLLDGLSRRLLLPVPGWMPAGKVVDHWARGHRCLIASRLMEELSDRSAPRLVPAARGGPLWRRLRQRLRDD